MNVNSSFISQNLPVFYQRIILIYEASFLQKDGDEIKTKVVLL